MWQQEEGIRCAQPTIGTYCQHDSGHKCKWGLPMGEKCLNHTCNGVTGTI